MKKKFFGTDGIRGRVGDPPITADWILKLGWAIGKVLASQHNSSSHNQVIIGKDTRISGYLFESALQSGLASAGVDILLTGPMPTPSIAFLTRALRVKAGIVISASHNPYYDNGIKIFSSMGTKLTDEFEFAIEEKMEAAFKMVESKNLGKAFRLKNVAGRYIEFCKNTFPNKLSLNGLKLVIDCANGATYKVAPAIFKELGAEILTLGVKPNGCNINDHCGSTYLSTLIEKLQQEKADVGIAFDGDGDRVMMVDHTGAILDGDELIFIIAKWYQGSGRLRGGIVGTVMSNSGLELACKNLGIEFDRAAVGDHNVLEMMNSLNWNLGGEPSGHIICLDENTTGDGIISALQVLAVLKLTGKSLFELKQDIKKLPQVVINVSLTSKTDPNLIQHPKIQTAIATAERHLLGKGRALIRRSGTESLYRVMVEGQNAREVQSIAEELAKVIQQYS